MPRSTGGPPILGFRGFIVDNQIEDGAWRRGLPARFDMVHNPTQIAAVADSANERVAVEPDVAEWLLGTAEGRVQPEILEAARQALGQRASVPPKTRKATTGTIKTPRLPRSAKPACAPVLTPFYPAFWNVEPTQMENNCYNYAVNFASNTVAQPGRGAGDIYTAFDCDAVLAAAIADGCLTACAETARMVALAIWPGLDFHWWRLHSEGFWAHKLGLSTARNFDNSGRIIGNGLTPATCDRGPYTLFCGFFYTPIWMRIA